MGYIINYINYNIRRKKLINTFGKILLATNNPHKISEIKFVLNTSNLKLLSLKDFGVTVKIIEDENSLEKNAFKKAKEISRILNIPTLADDTGLFVKALNDEPGIYSARYAGENVTYEENRKKLLDELKNIPEVERSARFESVICFYVNQKDYYFFEGVCEGNIIHEARGTNGFGYDPLFIPDGECKTFAELSDKEKNKISHRAIALRKFKEFFESASSST